MKSQVEATQGKQYPSTRLQVEAGVLSLGPDGEDGHVHFALNACMIAAAHAWAGGAPFSALREHTKRVCGGAGPVLRATDRIESTQMDVGCG
mgnify:CR=1 FL=1